MIKRIFNQKFSRNWTLVLNFNFKISWRIDFYKTIVYYWVVAFYDWAHEVAHNLKWNRSAIFYLDVEVCHAFTPFLTLHRNLKVYMIISCINYPVDNAISLLTQAFSLGRDINFEAFSVLALKSELVLNLSFWFFLESDWLGVQMVDICVTFEEAVARLNINFTRVSLSSQVKLDHRDAQKLRVRTNISWHRHFTIFDGVRNRKVFQALWWISNTRNRDIFND